MSDKDRIYPCAPPSLNLPIYKIRRVIPPCKGSKTMIIIVMFY